MALKLDTNTQNIIGAFISSFVIPELVSWIRNRAAAGLPPPTEDELVAQLHSTVGKYLTPGEAFLAEHGIVLP